MNDIDTVYNSLFPPASYIYLDDNEAVSIVDVGQTVVLIGDDIELFGI